MYDTFVEQQAARQLEESREREAKDDSGRVSPAICGTGSLLCLTLLNISGIVAYMRGHTAVCMRLPLVVTIIHHLVCAGVYITLY